MAVTALDTTTVAAPVKDATTAPSMHNAQPCRFRYRRDSGNAELCADPERAMPHADPVGRALHIDSGPVGLLAPASARPHGSGGMSQSSAEPQALARSSSPSRSGPSVSSMMKPSGSAASW